MSTKISYDPDWQTKYAAMIATPEQALARVKPGERVFIGTGAAEPRVLVDSLAARAGDLADIEIVHLITFGPAPYAKEALRDVFRVNSFFIADNVRELIQEGLGDYTPIFLYDVPQLFNRGQMPIDVALIQVTPPDLEGRCSLGLSVDVVRSATENAALVIAEINPNMPRTHGNAFLHVYDLDVLVAVNTPMPEIPMGEPTEESRQVAEYISALVEDGSTLELGIGSIPQALMSHLAEKKDLGIHTEMITDGIIELVKSGVVNGSRKTLDRGKVVTSFCLGTKKLYDFVDNNPAFAFHPTEYVNDPAVISQQHKMVAVNTALEVDLTGQVCADSIGDKFYSGIGGQVDFNRGATRSVGGKSIIALQATAKDGEVSRIVCKLDPGAGVVTTRGGVHYVATEFGVAYLHGKSIQERALALISIAHPKFQAQLLREAVDAKYLSGELADKEDKIVVGPKELYTTYVTSEGTQISFRPIHPTDEPRMRSLFYALSQQTVYYRFMSATKQLPRKQVRDFVFIDHRTEVALVGTLPEASGEEIVAVGRYWLDPKTNRAEIAFTVQDRWQRKGVGTFLFRNLVRIARRNGIKGFSAEVLADNKPMQKVFNRSNLKTQCKLNSGVYSYVMDFD